VTLVNLVAGAALPDLLVRVKADSQRTISMTEPTPDAIPIDTMSFEAALDELERLVARLESGQASLEDSITLYERGAKLKAHCDARLKSAQMRVDQIVETPTGIALEPAKLG
jgi:exodeoxyribonuclease VII small subunit